MALPEIAEGISLPSEVRRALDDLLEIKSRTKELGLVPRSPLLDQWIHEELVCGRQFAANLQVGKLPVEACNTLFRRHVMAGRRSRAAHDL